MPPQARRGPVELAAHGHVRTDDYYWLRERGAPEVTAYLEAENAYSAEVTAPLEGLRNELYEEIRGRIKQTDASVPYRLDDYVYYTRYEEGRQYPVYARRRAAPETGEEVLLDVNALAEGHDYFAVGPREVSPGQDLLAYAVDTAGRRIYTLFVKDLTTGAVREDVLPDASGSLAWAADNRTLFYARQDPLTLRSYRIYRHLLGTDPTQDALVYEEADEAFSAYVFKAKSRRYLLIGSFQTVSSEYRYLDAADPRGAFQVFLPRERDHEYQVDHYGDRFYVRTNDGAKNFRLVSAPVGATGRAHWEEVLPHRDDVYLGGFELFADYLVAEERRGGLVQLRVRPWADPSAEHYLDFGEPAYHAYLGQNPMADTPLLRYHYTSLTTPGRTYDYHMGTREGTLLKQEEVLGGFRRADYVTERLHATSADGVQVPVSVVYRRDTPLDGTSPLLLYGYGAYGLNADPMFSAARLSLLDRGFVYAVAHVRGGQELGRAWYEDGRLLRKKNTFADFIAAAEHLVAHRYAHPGRLFASGASAGGLLMGAVLNDRPDLFAGVIASVPFVDVVTTMLDERIPLTTGEYDEWGNPHEEAFYRYMLSYSPYDNVGARAYPPLLVVTGVHDSQVQYWEPAKWVAKLRALKTDANPLLLKVHMEAGHAGVSGRYEQYRETAFQYAFLIDLAGGRAAG